MTSVGEGVEWYSAPGTERVKALETARRVVEWLGGVSERVGVGCVGRLFPEARPKFRFNQPPEPWLFFQPTELYLILRHLRCRPDPP